MAKTGIPPGKKKKTSLAKKTKAGRAQGGRVINRGKAKKGVVSKRKTSTSGSKKKSTTVTVVKRDTPKLARTNSTTGRRVDVKASRTNPKKKGRLGSKR